MTIDRDRTNARALAFLEAARVDGRKVTCDNRVGLKYGAQLVGLSYSRLRMLIAEGKGPPVYSLGFGADKRTVSLIDLAEWVEHRVESQLTSAGKC